MKILHFVFCSIKHGYGHWYRSMALARCAQERGHIVYVASDRIPPEGIGHISVSRADEPSLSYALKVAKPDWLIVDIPNDLPDWIRAATNRRIATLNGIGYNQNDHGPDLRIIQGVDDLDLPGAQDNVPTLKGAEYVILRPELAKYQEQVKGEMTAVWGGGADVLHLLARFPIACPGTLALLLAGDMTPIPSLNLPTQTIVRLDPESEQIFDILAGSRKVVAAMGVIAWESNYLGLDTKIFSATPLHLRFATAMERHGYIKAWPTVGLPSNEEIKAFVNEPFEPWARVDLLGAQRVMEAIENYG
jgi:spore coat polysaccharide biosynthesis predicted glycosyltransferase SpsG